MKQGSNRGKLVCNIGHKADWALLCRTYANRVLQPENVVTLLEDLTGKTTDEIDKAITFTGSQPTKGIITSIREKASLVIRQGHPANLQIRDENYGTSAIVHITHHNHGVLTVFHGADSKSYDTLGLDQSTEPEVERLREQNLNRRAVFGSTRTKVAKIVSPNRHRRKTQPMRGNERYLSFGMGLVRIRNSRRWKRQ